MQCPNDNVTLVMSERSGIEIDYCPQCRGVWLDRGELDKIIERAGNQQPQSAPTQQHNYSKHSDSDRRHSYNKKRKKEGFLGDLFDF
jgi:Zn-finger nucleic acid-binding protein